MKFKYSFFYSLLLAFQTIVPSGVETGLVSVRPQNITFTQMVKQCEKLHKERENHLTLANGFALSVVTAATFSYMVPDFGTEPYMNESIVAATLLAFVNYCQAFRSKYEPLHDYLHRIKTDFRSRDISRYQEWLDHHHTTLKQPDLEYPETIIGKTIADEVRRMYLYHQRCAELNVKKS